MDDRDVSLRDLVSILAGKWYAVVLPAVALAVAAFFALQLVPSKYEATAYLVIGRDGNRPLETVGELEELMSSHAVRLRITRGLSPAGDTVRPDLPGAIDYKSVNDLLKVSVISTDTTAALRTVESIVGIIIERHEGLYEDAVELNRRLYDLVESDRDSKMVVMNLNELKSSKTKLVQRAMVDSEPVPQNRGLIVLAVFLSVMFAGMLFVLFMDGQSADVNRERNTR